MKGINLKTRKGHENKLVYLALIYFNFVLKVARKGAVVYGSIARFVSVVKH